MSHLIRSEQRNDGGVNLLGMILHNTSAGQLLNKILNYTHRGDLKVLYLVMYDNDTRTSNID